MDDNTASTSSTLLSQIMIGSMVLTISVVALLFILHVYAKWYWSSRTEDPSAVDWRRRQAAVSAKPRGLEPSALISLPVVSYDPKDFKEGLECAVCLSELSEGEKARVLPKCNHGFHLECIDVWFKSHSTCPLCRTLVVDTQPNPDSETNNVDDLEEGVNISTSDGGDNGRPRNPAFPTNVLFWGDDTEVSSSSVSTSRDVELVIQVPTEPCEDGMCSSPDEARSPIMTKLRSLKRLLSRGKRVAMAHSPGTGSSSGAHDQV